MKSAYPMNPRLPYHILNTAMIAGGVGFMVNMLNLVDFLQKFNTIHFLIVIGGAIFLKFIYGFVKPHVKDPITSHSVARAFFFLSMLILATALVMRNYHLPHYNILLYLDIIVQSVALGISFSVKPPALNDEILDA